MILHSAIKRGVVVYVGRRHHDCIRYMIEMGVPSPATRCDDGTQAVQGFVTDEGVFLDRQAAYTHAYSCGQIKPGDGHKPGTLFSEDLW